MHSIRKLVFVAMLALMAVAGFASSASALQATAPAGTVIPLGTTVSATSSNSTLLGTIGTSSVAIKCTDSVVDGTVDINGPTVVYGEITQAVWTGCSNEATGASCNVSAVGLPWNTGNHGGLMVTSTSTLSIGTGSGSTAGVQISTCIPTCTFHGGNAGPTSDGGATLENYVNGSWANSTSAVGLSSAFVNSSLVCGTGHWTATYSPLKTSGGSNVIID